MTEKYKTYKNFLRQMYEMKLVTKLKTRCDMQVTARIPCILFLGKLAKQLGFIAGSHEMIYLKKKMD